MQGNFRNPPPEPKIVFPDFRKGVAAQPVLPRPDVNGSTAKTMSGMVTPQPAAPVTDPPAAQPATTATAPAQALPPEPAPTAANQAPAAAAPPSPSSQAVASPTPPTATATQPPASTEAAPAQPAAATAPVAANSNPATDDPFSANLDLEKIFKSGPNASNGATATPAAATTPAWLDQVRQKTGIADIQREEDVVNLVEGYNVALGKLKADMEAMRKQTQSIDPVALLVDKKIKDGLSVNEIIDGLSIVNKDYQARDAKGYKVSDREVFEHAMSEMNVPQETVEESWVDFNQKSTIDKLSFLSTWREKLQRTNQERLKEFEQMRNEAHAQRELNNSQPIIAQVQQAVKKFTDDVQQAVPKVTKVNGLDIPQSVIREYVLPNALKVNDFMQKVLYDESGNFKGELYVNLLLTEHADTSKQIREQIKKSFGQKALLDARDNPAVSEYYKNKILAQLALEQAMPGHGAQTATGARVPAPKEVTPDKVPDFLKKVQLGQGVSMKPVPAS